MPSPKTASKIAEPKKTAAKKTAESSTRNARADVAPIPAEKITPDKYIIVKGARQHNLKNIDITLPRDKLIVITGLSGSGKSSLAFDTIYAEGQRRYVESLSAYARQFLGQMDKPDVDFIEGLSPAVSIDQKTASRNPRSTVATVTEIYDYLRLLFARIGEPHCPNCGRDIKRQSLDQIVDGIMKLGEGARLHILAPLVRGRKGEYKKIFEDARKKGFARVRVNGTIYNIDEADDIKLERYEKHDIEIVVDRAIVKNDAQQRLTDSVQTALKMGEGIVMVEIVAKAEGGNLKDESSTRSAEVLTFSEHFACAVCDLSFEELEPRTFSFNSPYGACPECNGLGTHQEFDAQLVVPDTRLSVDEGAVAPWKKSGSNYKKAMLRALADKYSFDIKTPWNELTDDQRSRVLDGSQGDKIHVSYVNMHGRRRAYHTEWEGVLASLQNEYAEYGDKWKEELQKWMSDRPCKACKGARLKPFPLAVTVADKNISHVTASSVGEAAEFFTSLRGGSHNETTLAEQRVLEKVENIATGSASSASLNGNSKLLLNERDTIIARPILKEIQERLQFLVDVGLNYLTLDRAANTLAGGEAQRIRLATQIGSGLVGVLYVLDEPSIGFASARQRKTVANSGALARFGQHGYRCRTR